MSALAEWHKTLDEHGVGKCSVPMWSMGGPSGFCDEPAYGFRPAGKTHVRWDGFEWRDDHLYPGYVPALACPGHGGPETRCFKDGNQWCAVRPDFTNLQASPAGFGYTPELARKALLAQNGGEQA